MQPASRVVWCFGINYEDPKYLYIQGMAGALRKPLSWCWPWLLGAQSRLASPSGVLRDIRELERTWSL